MKFFINLNFCCPLIIMLVAPLSASPQGFDALNAPTLYKQAIRCIAAISLDDSAEWPGAVEHLTSVVIKDPAYQAALNMEELPALVYQRKDIAPALVLREIYRMLGMRKHFPLPTSEVIRHRCQTLARSYG